MPTTLDTLMIAAASGIGGGGVSRLFRVRSRNNLDNAESAKALAAAYSLLIDDLREQIAGLREDNAVLRERIAGLEAKLNLYTNPPT